MTGAESLFALMGQLVLLLRAVLPATKFAAPEISRPRLFWFTWLFSTRFRPEVAKTPAPAAKGPLLLQQLPQTMHVEDTSMPSSPLSEHVLARMAQRSVA